MFGRKLPQFCKYVIDSRSGVIPGWRFIKVSEVKPVMGF